MLDKAQHTKQKPNIFNRSSNQSGIKNAPKDYTKPREEVGPAYNFEIPEPSGSCGSIRLVKFVSTKPFSYHKRLSAYAME